MLRASKPGGLREGLLEETSLYAPIADTLQVFDTLSSELTERERHILTSQLMVRTKGVGNDSQAYWLSWSASQNPEFKTAVGRALAQSLDSDADIPDALRLASGGDGPTIWRAFRQIGEANPTKAWETATNFTESERRHNAQLGVLTAITVKEGYKFALEFVRSSSPALDVPLLNLSLVSEWLEKSPIDASDWVNKNGDSSKGLYMAVSKYCEKQGDIEAARIWAKKAKGDKIKAPNR